MHKALLGLEPREVFRYISEILAIPRPSTDESKIDAYLIDWAEKRKYGVTKDVAGNIAIHVLATNESFKKAKPVCVQWHKDMVYDQEHLIPVPIDVEVVDGWLQTKGRSRTLGADNFVGGVLGMEAAEACIHGPLILLATSREEIGLKGTLAFRPEDHGISRDTLLINLDTPEDAKLTMSSAGWLYTRATWRPERESAPAGNCQRLTVTGLLGGHSGDHIHLNRGNALKVMGHLLASLPLDSVLVEFDGGEAGNSIPSAASAVVRVSSPDWAKKLNAVIEDYRRSLERPEITLAIEPCSSTRPAFTRLATTQFIKLVGALPTGVIQMSAVVPDLPELSSTLAMVKAGEGDTFVFTHLVRGADDAMVKAFTTEFGKIYSAHGCEVNTDTQGHGCKLSPTSPLVQTTMRAFESQGRPAQFKGYHCTVELGPLLGDPKNPNFADGVSFGAEVLDEHAPSERMNIESFRLARAVLHNVLADVAHGR